MNNEETANCPKIQLTEFLKIILIQHFCEKKNKEHHVLF
jgi:hypothetical protein